MGRLTRKQDFTGITLTLWKHRKRFQQPFSLFQISTRVTTDNFIETGRNFLKCHGFSTNGGQDSKVDKTFSALKLFILSNT